MKFIKYSFLALAAVASLTSCLKAKNDFGGLREDAGKPVIAISEKQYQSTDINVIGYHYPGTFANFSFATANESVRFFTLHISQPRENKLSGNTTVKFTMSPAEIDPVILSDLAYTLDDVPAGAINITDVVIPGSDASSFDVPVRFTVNKSLLDPTKHYAARFTITSTTAGVVSELDKSIDVIINPQGINNSRYNGRYVATTTVVDSARVYGVTNNTRPYIVTEGRYDPYGLQTGNVEMPGYLFVTDLGIYGVGSSTAYSLYANNLTVGTNTALTSIAYKIDATGKVIDVVSRTTLASLNPVFDASSPNAIVVTANDKKELNVKYTIRLTLNSLNRPFTITERYVYDDDLQVML